MSKAQRIGLVVLAVNFCAMVVLIVLGMLGVLKGPSILVFMIGMITVMIAAKILKSGRKAGQVEAAEPKDTPPTN